MATPYDVVPGERAGTATFRLMPSDDPASGPSTGTVEVAAGGRALTVTYTWTHPDDGEQTGTLLLGVADAGGDVTAGWVDTWHQPDVVALRGHATPVGAVVGYEYGDGWRWEVELEVADGVPQLVMRNLVPSHDGGPATAYEVSRTSWA
ncbi:hypothetical protein [Nocardioides zeicaulis]|uniref:DUF1579 domain-containing protein n=1 Tax=Nocardioides zeicaulis TaxID=1776857 RepID=A0ABV6E7F6_9ACTN